MDIKMLKQQYQLSMEEFLEKYANLDGIFNDEMIGKLKSQKVTHTMLSGLQLPYLKRIPYDIVRMDDLLTGRVLLVNDFRNQLAPYVRPELVIDKLEKREKIMF